jgi:hypothetical protein
MKKLLGLFLCFVFLLCTSIDSKADVGAVSIEFEETEQCNVFSVSSESEETLQLNVFNASSEIHIFYRQEHQETLQCNFFTASSEIAEPMQFNVRTADTVQIGDNYFLDYEKNLSVIYADVYLKLCKLKLLAYKENNVYNYTRAVGVYCKRNCG